ncbi:Hpt domain-containing protein [Brachybacterium tyrofermentans]|uniref:Hpt domain-containing protein n=1 Tax=Brachybacterium tyrofermentans TaxID=47848 RepID=UPI003FD5B657
MPTVPVLDCDVLRRLGEQLGDVDILCRFLDRYLALLDQRLARLEHALTVSDQAGWADAVLSLKTSSEMAGARALAARAEDLQQESMEDATGAPGVVLTRRADLLACLRRLAAETARQLHAFLERVGCTSQPT